MAWCQPAGAARPPLISKGAAGMPLSSAITMQAKGCAGGRQARGICFDLSQPEVAVNGGDAVNHTNQGARQKADGLGALTARVQLIPCSAHRADVHAGGVHQLLPGCGAHCGVGEGRRGGMGAVDDTRG